MVGTAATAAFMVAEEVAVARKVACYLLALAETERKASSL
jgi:hypothetical protein